MDLPGTELWLEPHFLEFYIIPVLSSSFSLGGIFRLSLYSLPVFSFFSS